MKDEKVVVFPCPEEGRIGEAKLQIAAAVAVLHQRAAEAAAHALYCEGQSVRLDTILTGCADEELVRVRDALLDEGLLEIEDPIDVTCPGGQA